MDEMLITYGAEVKDLGDGKIGGLLCVFGSPEQTDLEGDFFTPETDFGVDWEQGAVKSLSFYAHGLDPVLKKKKLPAGEMKMTEAGVWFETQLEIADEYQAAIYKLVKANKAGFSSGTAAHLVEREKAGKAYHLKHWPLGLDASITPKPAEPRAVAVALKEYGASLQPLIEAGSPSLKMQDYAEEDATMAALQSLNNALFYGCVYQALYDESRPLADRLDVLKQEFGAFSDSALRIIESILSGDAEEDAADAAMSVKALWPPPISDPCLRSGQTFESHTVAVLTAVKGWQDRLAVIQAWKSGRKFSAKNRARIEALLTRLDEESTSLRALLAESEPAEKSIDLELLRVRSQMVQRRALTHTGVN